MKVFLSWSGSVSKEVALALREWLPNVIQAIDPWMSAEDIEKGARWSSDVANELATTKAGIVCVTPDNREAAWLNFEAGALSKTVEKEMVCPYLFRLKPSDLTGPLVQFQASEANKEDTRKLIASMNRATAKPLSDSKLQETFEVWWDKLDAKLSAIPLSTSPRTETRTAEDMLEEVLGTVRDQSRSFSEIMVQLKIMETETAKTQYPAFWANSMLSPGISGGMLALPGSDLGDLYGISKPGDAARLILERKRSEAARTPPDAPSPRTDKTGKGKLYSKEEKRR